MITAGVFLGVLLAWQFPRDYTPQPTQFVLTYGMSALTTLAEMSTDPSAEGACAGAPESDADTYCTTWPTCPPAGEVVLFWAQAVWAEERSGASDLLACQVRADCTCQAFVTAPPTDGQPAPPDGTPGAELPVPRAPPGLPVFQPPPLAHPG